MLFQLSNCELAKEAIEPFLTKHPHEYLADTTVKQSIDTMHGYCADVFT